MLFFKKRISFKNNSKVDLLHSDKVIGLLKIKNVSENSIDQNELNLKYFFIAFIKYLLKREKNCSFSDYYFIEIIKSFNPKILLGHDMTGITFRVKKLIPSIITISYQLAFIFKNDENFYKKNFLNKNTNYYLVYDERSKKMMQKYVKAKYEIFGSVKSSFVKIPKKNKKIKYDLLYISPFRGTNLKTRNNLRQNKNERDYLGLIKNYCLQNKKTICIALSSNRKDKDNINQKDEKEFYKSIIPFANFENLPSIQLIGKSKIILNTLSNLGYELLFAKEKVLFLTSDKEKLKFFFDRKLPFVYFNNSGTNLKSMINKLSSLKKNQWNNILSSYINNENCKKKLKLLITTNI
jgi:surface carbohydrate biosynthesis protein